MTSSEPQIGMGWYVAARVVGRLYRLSLLVQVASVAVAAWGIATFGSWTSETGLADATHQYDAVKRASGMVGLVVNGVAVLVLSAWIYRAHRSDRVSSQWTEHWAGWSFLGWVPPFCLFMPYGIIRDVRRGAEGRIITAWPALGWWMITLFFGMSMSWLAAALYAQSTENDLGVRYEATSYSSGAWLDLISGVVLCCSLLLLLRVVRTVTRVVTDSPFGAAAPEPALP